MAKASARLVHALRVTATRIEDGGAYKWSHYGKCNCGHLAQTLTGRSPKEIYEAAFQRPGDWAEQTREFCISSGYTFDHIIETMLAAGLDRSDLEHLERLSHPSVLQAQPEAEREFQHTRKEDAVRYFRAWSDVLANSLTDPEKSQLRQLEAPAKPVGASRQPTRRALGVQRVSSPSLSVR